jgi:predicted ATPase
MIEELQIKNFKSIKDLKINFSNLNVLAGINGSGKSSIIQSILLSKKYFTKYSIAGNPLHLNDSILEIGNVKDALSEGGGDICDINIKCSEYHGYAALRMLGNKDSDQLQTMNAVGIDIQLMDIKYKIFDAIQYLKAERLGPRMYQDKNSDIVISRDEIGFRGEYVFHYIYQYLTTKLEDVQARYHENALDNSLEQQLENWLSDICPNISHIKPRRIDGTNFAGFGFSMKTSLGESNIYRPTNVGFGLSYILPVLVLLLKAKKGTTIIIDTPEAHLHPRGQVKIGELLAYAAADGVQIIVETHSDHIINGIRLAVVKQFISPDAIKFMYCSLERKENDLVAYTKLEIPEINENGQFDYWPEGFFDQWSISLKGLLSNRASGE